MLTPRTVWFNTLNARMDHQCRAQLGGLAAMNVEE
jgi:hypothetical protein